METQDPMRRFSEALLRVAGDTDLLAAMAAFVVDDAPQVHDELKSQVEQNHLSDAAATAHKLKGMLSTFETGGPVLELHELIVAARSGDFEECKNLLSRCEVPIEELIHEISMLQESKS